MRPPAQKAVHGVDIDLFDPTRGIQLTVIGATRFETDRIRGITVEDFLLGGG